jgi:hypothetical protein
MHSPESHPWVSASMAEGLEGCVIKDLKPGNYLVRLYFAEPDDLGEGHRSQSIKLQGQEFVGDFNIVDEAGGVMRGAVKDFANIHVLDDLTLELSAAIGKTIISGIELIRIE